MKRTLALLATLAAPLLAAGAGPAAGVKEPARAAPDPSPAKAAAAPAAPSAPPAPAAAPAEPAGAPAAAASGASMRVTLSVPLFSEHFASVPVAAVEDEVITLAQLNELLAQTHEGRSSSTGAKGKDFTAALDRLIDMRLLVIEARDMDLDELPEVKAAIRDFQDIELREVFERRATRSVKPDAMEVERRYREAVREWKVRSVRFASEADAKAFAADLQGGKPWEALAGPALASKKATGTDVADWAGASVLAPAVAEAVAKIQAGGSTAPVAVDGGFAVVRVEAIRYRDDPAAREKAQFDSLERRRAEALQKVRSDLEKRYAKVDVKLLQSLDFEAPSPGFDALRKDRRALVTIKGEKPITVGDLTEQLGKSFFHGVEGPIKEKRVNQHKDETVRVMLTKRLFRKEAKRLGIGGTAEYREGVAEFERQQLFGKLAEKVIIPDVKVLEADGKDYYEKHKAELVPPAMFKLEAIAFASQGAAASALKRLQGGTEFAWLRANAEGRVRQEDQAVQMEGTTFSANALPPDLLQKLSGASRNDFRLWDGPNGQFYVVHVLEQATPAEPPYKAVRDAIVKRLYAENLSKAIHEYAAKLRQAHQVETFITRIGE